MMRLIQGGLSKVNSDLRPLGRISIPLVLSAGSSIDLEWAVLLVLMMVPLDT